jgi:hypothetical protein
MKGGNDGDVDYLFCKKGGNGSDAVDLVGSYDSNDVTLLAMKAGIMVMLFTFLANLAR